MSLSEKLHQLCNSARETLSTTYFFRDTKATVVTATVAVAAVSAVAFFRKYPFLFHPVLFRLVASRVRARISGVSCEESLLRHVVTTATQGDADSVLEAFHTFSAPMMHVGDNKGRIIDDLITKKKPKIAVEFGAYCGYSTVRTARLLPPGGHLYSIEYNPLFAAIATKVVEFAGLSERVTVIIGSAETKLPTLKSNYNVDHIDMLFIDHWKKLYVPDLKRVEQLDYLRRGSFIVADNILLPGAPEYAAYVRSSPKYSSTFFETFLDKSNVKDGIEVSVVEN